MKLVDANVLLYAVNVSARQHGVARQWLDAALAGDDAIGLPWLCLIAFTRLSTHPSVFTRPLSVDEALDRVEAWVAAPAASVCSPGPNHLRCWRELLKAAGGGGNLVNDAHLAALAIENNAQIVTFDSDFGRFAGVEWRTPAQLSAGTIG